MEWFRRIPCDQTLVENDSRFEGPATVAWNIRHRETCSICGKWRPTFNRARERVPKCSLWDSQKYCFVRYQDSNLKEIFGKPLPVMIQGCIARIVKEKVNWRATKAMIVRKILNWRATSNDIVVEPSRYCSLFSSIKMLFTMNTP